MTTYVAPTNVSGLDRYATNPSTHRSASGGPYPRSHAAPPPPLRSAAARTRQQTLGPVFSDEEDGDDSEYIAMRMQEMQMNQGYGRNDQHAIATAHMHQLQLQQQALAIQQQYLLQQLLTTQQQTTSTRVQPGSRDATTANAIRQQQLHQMQQLQIQAHMRQQQLQQQQQQHVDPRIQAQLLSQLQASARGPAQQQAELRAQAMAAQLQIQAQVQARAAALAKAQVQVQTQAQERKVATEKDLRARFDSHPNTEHARLPSKPVSPPTVHTPEKSITPPQSVIHTPVVTESPTKTSAPLGRFAQARQTASNPFGELTALLARRSAETKPEQPTTPTIASEAQLPAASSSPAPLKEDRLAARQGLLSLGLGRPGAAPGQNRAKSSPFPLSPATEKVEVPAARSVSLAQQIKPIRQPLGPPAPTNELGDRNFQANVRKQAGKGLGMLGRRAEGQASPVVA